MLNELAEVFSEEQPEAAATESESTEVEAKTETAEQESEASTKVESEETTETTSEEQTESESEDEGEKQEYSANEKALYKQAKDERQKRQERDQRIQELEAKLAELDKGESKTPDVFEDQEGFTESLRSEFQQELRKSQLDIQRSMMMKFREDYEEVEAAVIEEMKVNPVLKAELQKAPNVAEAVYDYGKKLAQFNEAKGFDKEAYEAKIKAEIEEKLRKEYEEKLSSESSESPSPSLASARGNSGKDEKAIENISDVFA